MARPTSAKVIGILQLIFGTLALLCGICSGVMSSGAFKMPTNNNDKDAVAVNECVELLQAVLWTFVHCSW